VSLRTEQLLFEFAPRSRGRGIFVVRSQTTIKLFSDIVANGYGFRDLDKAVPNGFNKLQPLICRQLKKFRKIFHAAIMSNERTATYR